MSILPSLLTATDLPEPELRVALLDGELYELGDCYSSVADFDVPWRRAASVADAFDGHVIACRATAAWIWGAGSRVPRRLEGCVSNRARGRTMPGRVSISEVVIDTDEWQTLGGSRVTTPARTMADIARLSSWSAADRAAVVFLSTEYGIGIERADAILWRRERLPHRVRAGRRLVEALTDRAPGRVSRR